MAVEWGEGKKKGKKRGKKGCFRLARRGRGGGGFFKTINRFCKGSCLCFCKWYYFDEIN